MQYPLQQKSKITKSRLVLGSSVMQGSIVCISSERCKDGSFVLVSPLVLSPEVDMFLCIFAALLKEKK